jgi:hypothetical protein
MGVGGQPHAPATFTPGKDPVPIVQEAGWASEPVRIGAEYLAPTGIRSPDLTARSESLHRLRHPGSQIRSYYAKLCMTAFFHMHSNSFSTDIANHAIRRNRGQSLVYWQRLTTTCATFFAFVHRAYLNVQRHSANKQ